MLEVHPYDINLININGKTNIWLWCQNKNSEPSLVIVKDFPVFCKIELPNFYEDGEIIEWDTKLFNQVIKNMSEYIIKKKKNLFTDWNITKAKKLYYYNEDEFNFILMKFNSIEDMYAIKNLCKQVFIGKKKKIKLEFWECDVDLYNKMFSYKKMGISDIFRAKKYKEIPYYSDKEKKEINPERISKLGKKGREIKEYVVKFSNIKPVKEEEKWISYPLILSWDLETYSHNPKCFPEKEHEEDVIFSVSLTFQHFLKPETLENYFIIIGPCRKSDSTNVISVKTENELIDKFFDLIIEKDPEIIIGYNVFGFDFPYINQRIIDSGEEWKNVGRTIIDRCEIKDISWSSSAYGAQDLHYLKAPGRITIDMLTYIKRDYKLSMYTLNAVSSYFLGEQKVDLTAREMFALHKKYIDNKHLIEDLEYDENFENNISHLPEKDKKEILYILDKNEKLVKYNLQDTLLPIKLFDKMTVWINLIGMSSVVRVTPMDVFTRGQQKRCIAQIYLYTSHNGYVMTRRYNAEYIYTCGGYVGKPLRGFHENVFVLDFNSLYPSIMIEGNTCFTTLIPSEMLKKGKLIDESLLSEEECRITRVVQEEPEIVKKEKSLFDYNDYLNYDPNEEKIEEENPDEKIDKRKNKKIEKKVMREYDVGFVKKEVRDGILPQIERNLLFERSKVKKKLKNNNKLLEEITLKILNKLKDKKLKFKDIKDEKLIEYIKKSVDIKEDEYLHKYEKELRESFLSQKVVSSMYDVNQLSLKVCANSLYGFLGAQVLGKFSCAEISIYICFMGRELIINSGLYFEKNFSTTTVYGDTDSVFLKFKDGRPFNYQDGVDMEKSINGYVDENGIEHKGIYNKPLYLELEKIIDVVLIEKKNYIYIEKDEKGKTIKIKGTDDVKLNAKGVCIARRDNYKLLTKTYRKIAMMKFEGKGKNDIFNTICDCVLNLVDFNFDNIDDLAVNKKMGSGYKSETYPLAILSNVMQEIGRPMQVGERFRSIVVLDHKGREKMGYRMRPLELFYEIWNNSKYKYSEKIPEGYNPLGLFPPEKIDPFYYINNLINPIDTLFKTININNEKDEEEYLYETVHRTSLKNISTETPMAMLNLILRDHEKLIKNDGDYSEVIKKIKNLKDMFL